MPQTVAGLFRRGLSSGLFGAARLGFGGGCLSGLGFFAVEVGEAATALDGFVVLLAHKMCGEGGPGGFGIREGWRPVNGFWGVKPVIFWGGQPVGVFVGGGMVRVGVCEGGGLRQPEVRPGF